MDRQRLILQIQSILEEFPEIQLAYLFGSHADGNPGPMSDIDIGVLIDRKAPELKLVSQLEHAIKKTSGIAQVDIVSFAKASIELAFAIIDKGICIHQQDVLTRVEFEAQVMSVYADFLPLLQAQREDILRGDEYGRREQRYREAFRRTERTLREIKAAPS